MRADAVGIFWQDEEAVGRGKNKLQRSMPPIPETGWTTPTELPNLSAAKALSFDVESYDPELRVHGPGWARGKGHIVGLAVGVPGGYNWYFPMRHTVEAHDNMNPDNVLAWARDTFRDPRQPKIGANITYDIGWLNHEGVRLAGDLHDVQFAEALLSESSKVALEELAQKYLGEHKSSALLYEWCAGYYGGAPTPKQRENIYRTPPRLAGPYAEGDVDLPFRILNAQWPLLHQQGLWPLYRVECELIDLMIAMRFAGVSVNLDATQELRESLVKERANLQRHLDLTAGFGVDVNSRDSLARLFDQYNVRYARTEKGNPSFTALFLDNVDHPVGAVIREIRQHDKLIGTFIDSYILNSNVNGKVYGQFHQLRSDEGGARSGRYASSNPNLQNIPIRTDLGKQIRRLFIPDYGHEKWRKYDYSQIEYRFLAHFAIGPMSDHVRGLYQTNPDIDFHVMTQQLILELTGQELARGSVKNTNFGLVYGMGVPALTRRLGLSKPEGKKLFASYHKGAPFIKPTMDACMTEAQQLGYITTIMGRRSRFDLWEPENSFDKNEDGSKKRAVALPYHLAIRKYSNIKRAYLHKALNRRLQGSAADLIKLAMHKCWKDGVFDRTGVPRLTVHDELDFSDMGGREDAFREMQHIMETALPISVPVRVGLDIGPNWGDVKEAAA